MTNLTNDAIATAFTYIGHPMSDTLTLATAEERQEQERMIREAAEHIDKATKVQPFLIRTVKVTNLSFQSLERLRSISNG